MRRKSALPNQDDAPLLVSGERAKIELGGISEMSLWRLRMAGKLRAVKIGASTKYDFATVRKLAEQGCQSIGGEAA